MVDFVEYKWKEPLGNLEEDFLFVRFNFIPESGKILVFAIIQTTIIAGEFVEVIRFDYSQNEGLHVHKFYTKNGDKCYLGEVVDFSMIEKLVGQVQENWRKYKLAFLNK